MPFCWDCRGTEATRTEGIKDNVGNYAWAIGLSFMNLKKVSYSQMYFTTLEITEKDVNKLAKYLTDEKIFNTKEGPATLEQNKNLVKLFVGSKFTRSSK